MFRNSTTFQFACRMIGPGMNSSGFNFVCERAESGFPLRNGYLLTHTSARVAILSATNIVVKSFEARAANPNAIPSLDILYIQVLRPSGRVDAVSSRADIESQFHDPCPVRHALDAPDFPIAQWPWRRSILEEIFLEQSVSPRTGSEVPQGRWHRGPVVDPRTMNWPPAFGPELVPHVGRVCPDRLDQPGAVVVQGEIDAVRPTGFGSTEQGDDDCTASCDAGAVVGVRKYGGHGFVEAHGMAEGEAQPGIL